MKYAHSTLVSTDWQALAAFYIQVFDCKMILPKRHLSGQWLSDGTGLGKATLKGAHLRLPGYEKGGPSLFIVEFDSMEKKAKPVANRMGLSTLSFEVESVQQVADKALQLGAKMQGKISQQYIDDVGMLHFVYLQDPEGNLIELQHIDTTAQKPSQEKSDIDQKPKKISKAAQQLIDKNKTPKSKRALLDELNKDLNDASKDLKASKEIIRTSKEALHNQKNKAIKQELSPEESAYLDDFLSGKKSKAELLEELKREMALEKDSIDSKKTEIKQADKKVVQHKTSADEKTNNKQQKALQEAAELTVEIKKNGQSEVLDTTSMKLDIPADKLAANLRAICTLHRPEDYEHKYIEWVGKIYKADIVPLVKFYDPANSTSQNETAWALKDRLRDSLKHLLGRCASDKALLNQLKLSSINLTIDTFIECYESYLSIVMLAEAKEAEYIRISFSKK